MQTLRRHFGRIIIGAVLAMFLYGLLIFMLPSRREQRIAQEIRSHGGIVEFEYAGPGWLPASIGYSVPWFARISSVELRSQIPETALSQIWSLSNLKSLSLYGKDFSDGDLKHLGQLKSLTFLNLNQTDVTDLGLKHVPPLTTLQGLSLDSTPVTDDGLRHLQQFTRLAYLNLDHTSTSIEGRAKLRKALPNCTIMD